MSGSRTSQFLFPARNIGERSGSPYEINQDSGSANRNDELNIYGDENDESRSIQSITSPDNKLYMAENKDINRDIHQSSADDFKRVQTMGQGQLQKSAAALDLVSELHKASNASLLAKNVL